MRLSPRVACVALTLTVPAAGALAETTNCAEITAIPYTIVVPGSYCLKKNLVGSFAQGTAIEITAAFAVLDLNGHRILNTAAPGNTAFGIHATNRENVVVRNGIVRGFGTAVFLEETGSGVSRGHIVEDMIVDRNGLIGVAVMGQASTVRRCQALAMGGVAAASTGINVDGEYHVVADNLVGDFQVADGRGIVTNGNDIVVVNNRVAGTNYGLQLSPTTKYRDNIVSDAVTPYSGGIDIGNNN
jgi:hypothetical protein